MAVKNFTVVRFDGNYKKNDVLIDLVPTTWILEENNVKKLYYPPKKDYPKIEEFVQNLTPWKKSWRRFKIEVLVHAGKNNNFSYQFYNSFPISE